MSFLGNPPATQGKVRTVDFPLPVAPIILSDQANRQVVENRAEAKRTVEGA